MMHLFLAGFRHAAPFICLLLSIPALAQFRPEVPKWVSTALNTNKTIDGYYESLPVAYTAQQAFPLIVYLHGDESVTDGYTEILKNGIPKLIQDGAFPETFKVKGQDHSFIVIAPHFTTKELTPDALDEAVNYIIKTYKVNTDRIYLTGMSRGGGYTWEYAGTENPTKLAAIVPVAGASSPNDEKAAVIANANLPVWATHNDDDPTVPAGYTVQYVELINKHNPKTKAKHHIFESEKHDSWTQTYAPDAKFEGKNIYEWMLQYTRAATSPLPVILTSYQASQTGATEVTVSWTTGAEVDNDHFSLECAPDGINFTTIATLPATPQAPVYSYRDKSPLPGANYYRLSQTDDDGTTTFFPVLLVTVDATGRPALALHPNPVTGDATLQLYNNERSAVSISVFNAAGLLVQQWRVQKEAAYWQQTFSFAQLPAGSYILQAQGSTFRHSIRFVKK